MGKKIYEQLGLTSRQKEILELVSKGCSNSDIAQLLNISPNTVKTHVATILERLDVSNRTEASVLYQNNFSHQQTAEVFNPSALPEPINVRFICESRSVTTSHITENIVQLLNAYEALQVEHSYKETYLQEKHSREKQSQDELLDIANGDFIIRLGLGLSDENKVQISLFESSESPRLLDKVEFSADTASRDELIKYAVLCYRVMMRNYSEKLEERRDNPSGLLIKALTLSEAVSHQTQNKALSLCELLIEQRPHWHLPYAIKSSLLYRMVTLGQATNKEKALAELVKASKQAFSIKPESSWSQLSFAYFAMLSSDLELAKKHLQASLEANPCQYKAMHFLGQILGLEGETEKGIELYQKLLQTFPRSESDGLCYGALSLLYYCSNDFENSKQAAHRALMYEDAPKVPLILNLISIAEIEDDSLSLNTCLSDIQTLNISPEIIKGSLAIASKIVPAALMESYLGSLKRAGLDI